VSTTVLKLSCRGSRGHFRRLGAQSLATWVIVAILAGCGNSAEARTPRKDYIVQVHIYRVGESFMCDAADTWVEVRRRFQSSFGDFPTVVFGYRGDLALTPEGYGTLSLDAFWSGYTYHYWKAQAPYNPEVVTLVALPPLFTPQGFMYGGMIGKVCSTEGNFGFVNQELGNVARNALILQHEVGHAMGAGDHCQPDRTELDPMCWEDAPKLKYQMGVQYSELAKRQILRCLGYRRRAGKTLCVGRKCRKNKRAK